MSTILCFGDSNTWGTMPQTPAHPNGRYDSHQRWPMLLQKALGSSYHIIEEGQPSRTVVHNAPFDINKSGLRSLHQALVQYPPALVLILLGTNDLKAKFQLTAQDIGNGIEKLIKQTLEFTLPANHSTTKVLLLSPPFIKEVGLYANIYLGGAKKSQQLPDIYQQCARQLSCDYFDVSAIVQSSQEDGIHWHLKQHQLLANALFPIVKSILSDK